MKKTIFLVGFIFLAKTSFSAAAPSQKALNLLNATFSQLENSSRKLSKQAQNSCSSLDEIKEEYFQLSAAWQRLWVFHVYPTTDENFKFKMQFFPDKKGRIRKELNKMLNKNQSWTVEDIANSRRYATGLPSIEFLLFDPSMEGRKNTQSYCSLLSALIRFIHLNLISPTKEKSLLWSQKDRSTKEAQELSHQFYNSMVIALENIKKLKLMRPALFKKNVVKPKRFESWRSQKSMDNILNNLEVVQSIFQETIPMANK